MVFIRELSILESCFFVRNSVLEKLRVKNFLDIQEQICCRALEEGDTLVNVTRMKRKKVEQYRLLEGGGLEKVKR